MKSIVKKKVSLCKQVFHVILNFNLIIILNIIIFYIITDNPIYYTNNLDNV